MRYTTSTCVAFLLCAALTHVRTESAPDPLCPAGSDDFINYPNPDDCSQYYQCYQGNKTLMQCPANFYWNTEFGYCDLAANVDCQQNTDPTAGPSTLPTTATPEPVTVSTTTPDPASTTSTTATSPTPVTGYTPDPMCPYPSETLIFYPYPSDCNKYYECFEGRLYVMSCPAKLYWNSPRNACDWPENVDCRVNVTTTTEPPTTVTEPTTTSTTEEPPTTITPATTEPTDSTTTTPVTDTTPTPSTTTGTTPVSLCYKHPDGTFISDPDDCSKYIECNLGKEIIGQCPDSLLWNESILSCDFPDHVDC